MVSDVFLLQDAPITSSRKHQLENGAVVSLYLVEGGEAREDERGALLLDHALCESVEIRADAHAVPGHVREGENLCVRPRHHACFVRRKPTPLSTVIQNQ